MCGTRFIIYYNVHVYCLFSQDKTHLTAISSFQKDIMTILPSHYNTFVDVMEFHDLVLEVVTSLATVQFILDIVSTAQVQHMHTQLHVNRICKFRKKIQRYMCNEIHVHVQLCL